jgi:hypothetical protein
LKTYQRTNKNGNENENENRKREREREEQQWEKNVYGLFTWSLIFLKLNKMHNTRGSVVRDMIAN